MKTIVPVRMSRMRKRNGRSICTGSGGLGPAKQPLQTLTPRRRGSHGPLLVDFDARFLRHGAHRQVHGAVHPREVGDPVLEHVDHPHPMEDRGELDVRGE
jgi:hypothetical protein